MLRIRRLSAYEGENLKTCKGNFFTKICIFSQGAAHSVIHRPYGVVVCIPDFRTIKPGFEYWTRHGCCALPVVLLLKVMNSDLLG